MAWRIHVKIHHLASLDKRKLILVRIICKHNLLGAIIGRGWLSHSERVLRTCISVEYEHTVMLVAQMDAAAPEDVHMHKRKQ